MPEAGVAVAEGKDASDVEGLGAALDSVQGSEKEAIGPNIAILNSISTAHLCHKVR